MKSLNLAPVREKQLHEKDLSRMSDEGCPNDPVLSLPNETGIEGVCNTLGDKQRGLEEYGEPLKKVVLNNTASSKDDQRPAQTVLWCEVKDECSRNCHCDWGFLGKCGDLG
jgi:hypothetical protein